MHRVLAWILTLYIIDRGRRIPQRALAWVAAFDVSDGIKESVEKFTFGCILISLTALTAARYWNAGILPSFWDDIHTISLRNIIAAFIASTGVDIMLGIGNSIVNMANWWMDKIDKKEENATKKAIEEAVEEAVEGTEARVWSEVADLLEKINSEEPGSDYRVELERHLASRSEAYANGEPFDDPLPEPDNVRQQLGSR